MMKYVIGGILTGFLLVLSFTQPNSAQAMMPEDLRQQIIEAEASGTVLEPEVSTFTNFTLAGTAHLLSNSEYAYGAVSIQGNSKVTTIMAFIYLEKQTATGWEEINSWNNTIQGNDMTYYTPNFKLPLGGTYHIRLSFYVYATTQYEHLSMESNQVSN